MNSTEVESFNNSLKVITARQHLIIWHQVKIFYDMALLIVCLRLELDENQDFNSAALYNVCLCLEVDENQEFY